MIDASAAVGTMYEVHLRVADASGNVGRTSFNMTVVDTVAPRLELLFGEYRHDEASGTTYVVGGAEYVEPGWEAYDDYAGDVSGRVKQAVVLRSSDTATAKDTATNTDMDMDAGGDAGSGAGT